jgi:hypothetical protein
MSTQPTTTVELAPPVTVTGTVVAPPGATVSVGHTAFSTSALIVAVLAFLAAIAAGATTIAHALPAGVPPSVGLWITGIGAAASALSLAIVGAVRAYVFAQKAGAGLFDPPVPIKLPPPPPQ